MFGSPLHWVYFLYFTVHAHEDRHGTGLIYQMGDTGSIPEGSKGLICEKCDWLGCDECIEKHGKGLTCFEGHDLKKWTAEREGAACDLCGRGSHPAHYIEKHMGGVLEKYFPRPPVEVLQRIFTESASHWNYTLCAGDFGAPDFFAVNGDCAINLADKFEWDEDILLDIFKAFVSAAEKDKVLMSGERALLDNLAGAWNIENPRELYSEDIEFRELPSKPKIEVNDDGEPLCLDCGGSTSQPSSFACGVSITFGPGGVTQGPIETDTNNWICDDCGYSFDFIPE